MKKRTIVGMLMLAALACHAQDLPRTFVMADMSCYSDAAGYGFDFVESPEKGSNKPYYFSVKVPDGNYRVTVTLGNRRKAGVTTVRAESRRLFVENKSTKKGEFVEETFVVNKRSPKIDDRLSVKIKDREKDKLDWDDRLTIEINGDAPQCQSIRVEPVTTGITTVYLCGNSTVVDQEREPWASWGQMIPRFFDEKVAIANHAESGLSANTFIGGNRLKKIISQVKPGDYIFVEFGHNDQKQKGPGIGAYYSFTYYMKQFIDEARAKGAVPVLVTPTRRRRFDEKGCTVNTHGDYPDAVRLMAAREHVALIELNEMTGKLYEALGVEHSKKAFVHYPKGTFPGQDRELADNTHFNTFGAYEVAKCVIAGMKQVTPELAKHLKDAPMFNPSHPDDPNTFHWCPAPFYEMVKPDGN